MNDIEVEFYGLYYGGLLCKKIEKLVKMASAYVILTHILRLILTHFFYSFV